MESYGGEEYEEKRIRPIWGRVGEKLVNWFKLGSLGGFNNHMQGT